MKIVFTLQNPPTFHSEGRLVNFVSGRVSVVGLQVSMFLVYWWWGEGFRRNLVLLHVALVFGGDGIYRGEKPHLQRWFKVIPPLRIAGKLWIQAYSIILCWPTSCLLNSLKYRRKRACGLSVQICGCPCQINFFSSGCL